jgi:hypothetical protein
MEGFLMPSRQAHQQHQGRTPSADFRVTYHGTITTITPLSDVCREWVEDNVDIEPWQRFGPSIAIEPRYVEQLAEAMIGEGLVIEGDDVAEEGRPSRGARRGWGLIVIAIALLPVLAQIAELLTRANWKQTTKPA